MFDTQTHDTHTSLILAGEIDLSNSDQARKQMRGILEQGHSLQINLELVGYIDSSGVAVLIEAMQETQRLGLSLGLVAVSEAVMQVLELAHLHTILPIVSRADQSADSEATPEAFSFDASNTLETSIETDQADPFDALFGDLAPTPTSDTTDKSATVASTPVPSKPSRNPFIG